MVTEWLQWSQVDLIVLDNIVLILSYSQGNLDAVWNCLKNFYNLMEAACDLEWSQVFDIDRKGLGINLKKISSITQRLQQLLRGLLR